LPAQVCALDLPGHGLTGYPLDVASTPPSWDFVGEQIRERAEQLREDARRDVAEQMVLSGRLGAEDSLEPVLIGVGHSLGGAGCVMAELQSQSAGGLFSRMLVWEPILFNPDPQIKQKRQAGGPDKAKASARRRADFDGPQQALESFATKPLFADWDRCVETLCVFVPSLSW
jgi:alpha-beta hydrolase superfamily lysophospholipase